MKQETPLQKLIAEMQDMMSSNPSDLITPLFIEKAE